MFCFFVVVFFALGEIGVEKLSLDSLSSCWKKFPRLPIRTALHFADMSPFLLLTHARVTGAVHSTFERRRFLPVVHPNNLSLYFEDYKQTLGLG